MGIFSKMINDEEGLLRSLQSFFKANLNTEIIAINAEKDDFSIDQIQADNDHYVFNCQIQDLPNHAFVSFDIYGDIAVKTNGNDKISIPILTVAVCFDNDKKAQTYWKSMRYMRAVGEVLLNFGQSVIETDGFQVTKVNPALVPTKARSLIVSGGYCQLAIS